MNIIHFHCLHFILRNSLGPQPHPEHFGSGRVGLEQDLLYVAVHLLHDLLLRQLRDARVLRAADEVQQHRVALRRAALIQNNNKMQYENNYM